MSNLKSKILEAIDRGLDQALQFDLNDYDQEDDLYISKKKTSLDKEDSFSKCKYEFNNNIQKLLSDNILEEDKNDLLTAISLGCRYTPKNKDELLWLITSYCLQFGWKSDLNWIDTSKITNMTALFNDMTEFNGDISKWDTSNVVHMRAMFHKATSFNLSIGNWDVSNVKDMFAMFFDATSFNLSIGNWDVSNVEDMTYMFKKAQSFNLDISKWNIEKLEGASFMFKECPIKEQYKPIAFMI